MMNTTTVTRKRTRPRRVTALPSLEKLQQLETFQTANAHIFPSVPSLRWFYRQHRAELLKAGAIVELAGRLLVDAPVFAETAMVIGRRAAAKRGD